jgi:Glycosyl transferases group 1/Glycosyl transferase 4-like domain
MKIAHGSAWYYPGSTGGTENHIAGLVAGLETLGIGSSLLISDGGSGPFTAEWRGAAIQLYQSSAIASRRPEGAARAPGFVASARASGASIYHQHAWAADCGLSELQEAKRLGLKTVLTILMPGNMCIRGTSMQFGERACGEAIREDVCTECLVQSMTSSRTAGRIAAQIPVSLSRTFATSPLAKTLLPAAAARARVRSKRQSFEGMVEACDRIIVVSEWQRQSLLANGVPAEKIALIGMGIENGGPEARRTSQPDRVRRLAYFGRYNATKGIDTVIRAMRDVPHEIDITLSVFGVVNGAKDERYRDRMIALSGDDHRIRFMPSVAPDRVISTVREFDAAVVPSTWMETGPLTVLEALAAGVPVIGSRLGGIAEKVTDGVDGLLLPPFEPAAWTAAFRRVATGEIRFNPVTTRVRSNLDVAADTSEVYRDVLAVTPSRPAYERRQSVPEWGSLAENLRHPA